MRLITRVSASDIQNLKCGLDVLGDYVLEAAVPLEPVKWLFVPMEERINMVGGGGSEWVTSGNGLPSIQVFRTVPSFNYASGYKM